MKKLTIAIDFDGVLHDHKNPVPGRRMGPPFPGALDAVRQLNVYHSLIVSSAREDVGPIRDWLVFYGFPAMEVTHSKPRADVYLDDRAVRFSSWSQALADIHYFIPH